MCKRGGLGGTVSTVRSELESSSSFRMIIRVKYDNWFASFRKLRRVEYDNSIKLYFNILNL